MQKSHGTDSGNRAPVSSSKEKKDADSGERGAQRQKRSKDKLIRLDDLIPDDHGPRAGGASCPGGHRVGEGDPGAAVDFAHRVQVASRSMRIRPRTSVSVISVNSMPRSPGKVPARRSTLSSGVIA